jgi:predicted nucleic acid-binding protein
VKWLLDTNVVSENIRLRPEQRVLAWVAARAPEQLAISIVTLAELREGQVLISGAENQRKLQGWIDGEIIPSFQQRTLPLTLEILTDWLLLAHRLNAIGPVAAINLVVSRNTAILPKPA